MGIDIRATVIGKSLGRLDSVAVPHQALGLSTPLILAMDRDGSKIGRLHFDRGELLVEVRSLWWRIRPSSPDPVVEPVVDVTQGAAVDVPATARWVGDRFMLGTTPAPGASRSSPAVVFGGAGVAAYLDDSGRWRIAPPGVSPIALDLEPGATVLGLVTVDDAHWLVVRSAAGQILRLTRHGATRTLTALSGEVSHVAVHPRLPLLAVSQRHHTVVVDLAADATLLRLASGQP